MMVLITEAGFVIGILFEGLAEGKNFVQASSSHHTLPSYTVSTSDLL